MPRAVVDKIYEGRGPYDTAGDCVACAQVFTKYAGKLKGKTPVTAAQVREAAEVGGKLLQVLRPKGAGRKEKAQALKDALDLRDRLGTLLAADYELVRRAGGWLFGEERDVKVPGLLAVTRSRKSSKAAKGAKAAGAKDAKKAPGGVQAKVEPKAAEPAKASPNGAGAVAAPA